MVVVHGLMAWDIMDFVAFPGNYAGSVLLEMIAGVSGQLRKTHRQPQRNQPTGASRF